MAVLLIGWSLAAHAAPVAFSLRLNEDSAVSVIENGWTIAFGALKSGSCAFKSMGAVKSAVSDCSALSVIGTASASQLSLTVMGALKAQAPTGKGVKGIDGGSGRGGDDNEGCEEECGLDLRALTLLFNVRAPIGVSLAMVQLGLAGTAADGGNVVIDAANLLWGVSDGKGHQAKPVPGALFAAPGLAAPGLVVPGLIAPGLVMATFDQAVTSFAIATASNLSGSTIFGAPLSGQIVTSATFVFSNAVTTNAAAPEPLPMGIFLLAVLTLAWTRHRAHGAAVTR